MSTSPPATITDWLAGELDKKLETLPSDSARVRLLAQQYGVWTVFLDKFGAFGIQPFGGPHPVYGDMDAFDFANVLALISGRKAALDRVPA